MPSPESLRVAPRDLPAVAGPHSPPVPGAWFWGLSSAAVGLLSLACFWPVFAAYFHVDDHAFVTISRYTDQPLVYFIETHFPVGLFYRPTGMLYWWLTVALGAGVQAQFLASWVLLPCAALLLQRVLMQTGLQRWLALAMALLFCAHPVSNMTAGWLSNRFDLLAVLGLLLAMLGGLRWFQVRPDVRALALTAFGTLLAVTSKETGLITPVVVAALALGMGRSPFLAWPVWISALIAAMLLALRQMLTSGTDLLFLQDGTLWSLFQGTRAWFARAPEFLLFATADAPAIVVPLLVACVLAVGVLVVRRGHPARGLGAGSGRPARLAMLLGLTIVLTSIVVQFPSLSKLNLETPVVTHFDADAYFAARFFYFGLVGMLMLVAGIIRAACDRLAARADTATASGDGRALQVAAAATFLVLTLGWASSSRMQGALWAQASSGTDRQLVEAAARALDPGRDFSAAEASAGCRYFLLGTGAAAPTFWPYADAAVKATVPADVAARLGRCLVSTEYTPWFHILRAKAPAAAGDLLALGPLQRTCYQGVPMAPQVFGTVEIHFLTYPPEGVTLVPGAGDRVLEYDARAGRFDDITAAVASGARKVELQWSRLELNRCDADGQADSGPAG